MCGWASPSTSPPRSARASSRRRCCARWCAKENSARRADAGSTSGMIDEPYGAFAYAYDKALGERFVFDMNHPEIYPVVWGMKEPFVEEGDDFALEIATSWHPRKRLGRALVRGWRRMPGGERVEIRERHEQRSYDEAEIVAALAEASLVPFETRTFDPYGE